MYLYKWWWITFSKTFDGDNSSDIGYNWTRFYYFFSMGIKLAIIMIVMLIMNDAYYDNYHDY